uniref:DUF3778 domain-containing protein n=1 Tax=Oryza punctata TaxID=4537 RepID=A0A0E0JPH4_ORYPU
MGVRGVGGDVDVAYDGGGGVDAARGGSGTDVARDDGGGVDVAGGDDDDADATCSGNGDADAARMVPSSSTFFIELPKTASLQLELLRFNDELHGNLLRSSVMLTPKSTASQQTSHMCRSRGGSRSVYQAECTSIEALGCSHRGIAAVPCRFPLLLLLSFIMKFASFSN